MARPNPAVWLPILDQALTQEIGVGFRVTGIPREQFRDQLYTARKASGDPRYSDLIMFLPGGDAKDQIFVCKKEVPLED